jgi:hypothetical protein
MKVNALLNRHDVLLLVASLWLAGCGAKQASAPATQAEPQGGVAADGAASEAPSTVTRQGSLPAPIERGAPAADVQTVEGIVDPFLTSQLRIFIRDKGRLPESFAELAGARLDSVPRLAKGLRFAIDPSTQEVKIVKQGSP